MDGEDLVISMMADAGTMRFAATPAEEAVEEAPAAVFNPADVVNATWQWEGTTTPVEEITVDKPGNYTLALLPGGLVQGKADCNRYRGTYTLEGQSITFGPLVTTRMMCPPGSQADEFLKELSNAALIFTEGENMFIDQFADGGTMKFSRRLAGR
jgi:heat shock protein HslJ